MRAHICARARMRARTLRWNCKRSLVKVDISLRLLYIL